MNEILKVVQGWVKLKGDTDGTKIGNIGDALKTALITDPLNSPTVMLPHTSYDSFGRMRVSDINNIFESTHVNTEQAEFWDVSLTGGATKAYDQQKAQVVLSVGTAAGDMAIRQTFNYFHYAAGQSMIVRMTGVLGAGKTGVQAGMGYGNNNNGLSFRTTNGIFEVVIRSDTTGSVIDNTVAQENFNGDKLDGTGNSGITIDLDKTHIFEINYQWLGVGNVQFYAHINGSQILLHTFQNANINNTVYMRTPHLPVRYGIRNMTATAGATSLVQICTQVANEGKSVVGDLLSSVDNDSDTISLNNSTYKPIISLRAKSTADILIQLDSLNLLVTTSDDLIVHVHVDATLTGHSWQPAESGLVEYDVSSTAVTGGRHILSTYMSKSGNVISGSFKDKFRLGQYIDGTKQTVTVSAKTLSNNASVACSLAYKELF